MNAFLNNKFRMYLKWTEDSKINLVWAEKKQKQKSVNYKTKGVCFFKKTSKIRSLKREKIQIFNISNKPKMLHYF